MVEIGDIAVTNRQRPCPLDIYKLIGQTDNKKVIFDCGKCYKNQRILQNITGDNWGRFFEVTFELKTE